MAQRGFGLLVRRRHNADHCNANRNAGCSQHSKLRGNNKILGTQPTKQAHMHGRCAALSQQAQDRHEPISSAHLTVFFASCLHKNTPDEIQAKSDQTPSIRAGPGKSGDTNPRTANAGETG